MRVCAVRKAFPCLVALFLTAAVAIAQTARPVANATVASGHKDALGAKPNPTLEVASGSSVYLQFDLSSIPSGSTLKQATLRLLIDKVNTAGSFKAATVEG